MIPARPTALAEAYSVDLPEIIPGLLPDVALASILSPDGLKAYADIEAHKNGVNSVILDWVGSHEGQWRSDAVGDKDFICKNPKSPLYGKISPSYGYVQINRCSHPEVSIEQAENPVFATQWAINTILQGRAYQEWSTIRYCHEWFNDCPL